MNFNFEYYKVFYYVAKYGSRDQGGQCSDDQPASCDQNHPEPGK